MRDEDERRGVLRVRERMTNKGQTLLNGIE